MGLIIYIIGQVEIVYAHKIGFWQGFKRWYPVDAKF
jgi:hypothetical protein